MPSPRQDAPYLHARITDLYETHSAKQIAAILNADPNVAAPVTERIIYNTIHKVRTTSNEKGFKNRRWTEEEDAQLRQLYSGGLEISRIAERLRRPEPSVYSRIKKLNLQNRKITPEQEVTIRRLLQETTMALREISLEVGVKYNAVRHVSDKVKKSTGSTGRHLANISFWKEGSLVEQRIRHEMVKLYGDAVIPWQRNREWSEGRGWQIDIPLQFPDGLKVAVEVNHVRVHANLRNRDYAKRKFAEQRGWIWVPIWYEEPTAETVSRAVDTIRSIVEERRQGKTAYYRRYMNEVHELERQYYNPEQPPYDPKAYASFSPFWSEADLAIIREHYGQRSLEEIRGMLSAPRTDHAILHKARQLGLTKETKNFSPEEDALLRELYPDRPKGEILARFPGRSWQSLTTRAGRLGIKRKNTWTEAEEELLRQQYGSASDRELLEMFPGRSLLSIRTRAQRLGLKKDSTWSEEEDNRLRALYPEEPRHVIQEAFPHRTWSAIVSRASRLGIRRNKPF
ncbi:hypothetical protein [Kyrpidia sp.]|uniref:hypothetical protein n=1 Tax=Kyrpidia sp. TaxID=2073077 RepID=UPI00258FBD3E|nr:hypothetical protein [Kyrpidia sp.]MCL6577540.1 hypothetical protein [Kyrpidia sp.]